MVDPSFRPTIGILALQGAVGPHQKHFQALGVEVREVRRREEATGVHAYVLPGGESTTMLRLLEDYDLFDFLKGEFSRKPVWGVCAGAILLCQRVENVAQSSFSLMDMDIQRNAYGRQLSSHEAEVGGYDVCFIRSPKILSVGHGVQVRAARDGLPVWVEQGHLMATTFHPELSAKTPSPMHRRFVELVQAKHLH